MTTSVTDKNQSLFDRAKRTIPGGVNSPVRAFNAVGGIPRFIQRAQGAHMWDEMGACYIDYIGSWGPMILGHAHEEVVAAVTAAAQNGFSFGTPTTLEIELVEAIASFFPSMEMVRLVNSGTEASMSAIRLARGATNRDKFIKFEGCYHGHADSLLVKAGSGLATLGNPTSGGVPVSVVHDTIVLEYNNCEQLKSVFEAMGQEIACIILEPIAGNMNFVRASENFIRTCQTLCKQYDALLIFDEVMTGLRVGKNSAQGLYQKSIPDLKPDLTILGKIIGGGMPLAAFGGRQDVMSRLTPLGNVYQAGTLSGNPIATTCGLATLKALSKPGFYEALSQKTSYLVDGLKAKANAASVSFSANCEGGMFGFFFLNELPQNYTQVMKSDKTIYAKFFHGMLDRGVYLAPALYEAGFVSNAHTVIDLDHTIEAASEVFQTLSR